MERTEAYRSLIQMAHRFMTECQDHLRRDFNLWSWPRYDWDQATGNLVFSDTHGPRVIAPVEFVGSISTESDTWMWAWANESLLPQVTSKIAQVREYGERHGIPQLITDLWHAHEEDGWEMTSIAGYVLGAKGAYRTPDDKGFTFMVMTDVQWVA